MYCDSATPASERPGAAVSLPDCLPDYVIQAGVIQAGKPLICCHNLKEKH